MTFSTYSEAVELDTEVGNTNQVRLRGLTGNQGFSNLRGALRAAQAR
ncbi:MAG TPA: hypothetical protein V6D33_08765 [Cyanophyceae cyanobacterium]